MSRRTQENLFAGLILLLLIGVVVMSYTYGPRARLVPVPVAVIGIVLTLIQIYWQNTRPAESLHIDLLEVLTDTKEVARSAPPAAKPATFATQVESFGIVGAFLAMFLALGPFPAIFLYLAGYLTLSGYSRLGASLVTATVVTIVLWVLFVEVLQMQVYWGLLEPLARSVGL
jgi:hypothetical protein